MQNQKSIPLRLPPLEADELRTRARFDGVSMNELVRIALRDYFERRPVPREKLLAEMRRIGAGDGAILDALKVF